MSVSSHLSVKSNFTKGGVAKRVFKPTIPSARGGQQACTSSESSALLLSSSSSAAASASTLASALASSSLSANEAGQQNVSLRNKQNKKKHGKAKKKLIQIEAIFNGIDAK